MSELKDLLINISEETRTKIIPSNIKEGVTIFGVEGSLDGGINTSDATATSADLLEGKSAYANDLKIEGTMKNYGTQSITPSTEDQEINQGYVEKVTIIGDKNLIEENIKKGITLFGVEGNLDGSFDMSGATATSADILSGKKAYLADGTLTAGTMPYGSQFSTFREVGHNANQSYISLYASKGYHSGSSSTAIYIPLKSQWSLNATTEHKRFINELFAELGITPDILKAGTWLYTISGKYTSDATATSSDIVVGKTAYVNGELVTGTLVADTPIEIVQGTVSNIVTNNDNTLTISGSSNVGGTVVEGTGISLIANNETVASAIGLAPDLIRSGANILGVEGTYDSNPEEYNAKFQMPEGQTSGLTALQMLVSVESLDTSNITDAANIFAGCTSLKSLPDMNLESATSTYRMCYGCSNLVYVPDMNIAKSQNTSNMFYGCHGLTHIPNINPIASTNSSHMFMNCSNLVDCSDLNVSYSTSTTYMFANCINLVNAMNINIYRSNNPSYMFNGCTNLQYVDLVSPRTNTTFAGMFSGCTNLRELPSIDFRYIANNPGSGGSLVDFCKECHNITSANLGGVAVYARYGHSFANAFYNCTNLREFSGLSHYAVQTGYETSYKNMFFNCTNLQYVNNFKLFSPLMNSMFADCHNLIGFTNCTINGQTYNGVVHAATFRNCYNLINADSVIGTIALNYSAPSETFRNCRSITFDKPVSFGYFNSRYASTITNMFTDCHSLDNIHLKCINMSSGPSSTHLFENCQNLQHVTLENFVIGLTNAFVNCHKLQYINFINSSYVRSGLFRNSGVLSVIDSVLNNGEVISQRSLPTYCYADCYKLRLTGDIILDCYNSTAAFANCYNLANISGATFTNIAVMDEMFINCTNLTSINNMTVAANNGYIGCRDTFAGCTNLTDIGLIDMSDYHGKGVNVCPFGHHDSIVNKTLPSLNNLINFAGFGQIGNNYATVTTGNNSVAAVDIVGAPQLSYESILNVTTNLANLYTVFNIASGSDLTYPQLIHMEANQYSKLTETDISNIQAKGWNITVHTIAE